MFPEIGGTEYLVIFVVALLVFKPQDLPVIAKKVGGWIGKARRMAADFRATFDDMARQSELDSLRKEVEAMRSNATKAMQAATNPVTSLANTMTETAADLNTSIREGVGPQPEPPATPTFEAEAPPAAPNPAPKRRAPSAKANETKATSDAPPKKAATRAKPAKKSAAE